MLSSSSLSVISLFEFSWMSVALLYSMSLVTACESALENSDTQSLLYSEGGGPVFTNLMAAGF